MHNPLKPSARWFLNRRVVTHVVWPAAIALPTIVFGSTQLQNLPAVEKYIAPLRTWFNDHPGVAFGCIGWTILMQLLSYWVGPSIERIRQHPDASNATELAFLLECFGETVGTKLERCGLLLQRARQGSAPQTLTAAAVLSALPDPEAQIRLLMDKIYLAFLTDFHGEDVELKIVLAEMNGINVEKYLFSAPRNHLPLNSIDQINRTPHGFGAATESRRMLIISDVASESRRRTNRRYSDLGADPKLTGSMICYPLEHAHLNKIPLVLSVKCNRKNHFTEEARKRYKFLISLFADRILLEYTLIKIKEKTV